MLLLATIFMYNWFFVFVGINLFTDTTTAVILSLLIMFGFTVWSQTSLAEKIARKSFPRKPDEKERKYIESLFEQMRKHDSTIKTPVIFVRNSNVMNAQAMGRNTICIFTGLLKNASSEEIYGVLAHEMGHLKNGDGARSLAIYTMNSVGRLATKMIAFALIIIAAFSKAFDRAGLVAIGLGIFAMCLRTSYSLLSKATHYGVLYKGRQEEFAADAYAVRMGGGAGLISLFNKINDPTPEGLIANLLSTHPSMEKRIERIQELMNTLQNSTPK
jgi:Zn-dependent protease with chaperone function